MMAHDSGESGVKHLWSGNRRLIRDSIHMNPE